jgi:hypothetical protein
MPCLPQVNTPLRGQVERHGSFDDPFYIADLPPTSQTFGALVARVAGSIEVQFARLWVRLEAERYVPIGALSARR